MLRAHLADFARQRESLHERQAPLRDALPQARAGQEAHEAWQRTEAPALSARIAALDAELDRRADERARIAERERPPYVDRALGPRPEHEHPRARRRQALRQLEGRRLRQGIADPERAFGPEPPDPAGRAEHRRALAELREACAQIERAEPGHRSLFSSRSVERDIEREHRPRGPGLGRDEGRGPEPRQGPSPGLGG